MGLFDWFRKKGAEADAEDVEEEQELVFETPEEREITNHHGDYRVDLDAARLSGADSIDGIERLGDPIDSGADVEDHPDPRDYDLAP